MKSSYINIFRELSKTKTHGVSGVWKCDSGKKGPVVGITIMTHGNEPSGLLAYHYLKQILQLEKQLMRGKVYVVINNLKAGQRYVQALKNKKSNTSRFRFIDINMNRLPLNVFSSRKDTRYETQRARELRNIWNTFEYALDIHSTTKKSSPMIISRGRENIRKLLRGFPIAKLISNIDAVQIGRPAFAFYGNGRRKSRAFSIETGQHEASISGKRAILCTRALLKNLNMLQERKNSKEKRTMMEYRIVSSVLFPNKSYEFIKEFRPFHTVRRGDMLARDAMSSIIAKNNSVLIMAKSIGTKVILSEEAAFISKPARKIKL